MPTADERFATELASRARFPQVTGAAAHYESFFLKACHPDGGLAVWIRYTVHKRPDEPPKGFVWFTLFDAAHGVLASKAEATPPTAPPGTYIELGESVFAPGRAAGAARSSQLDASWELAFHGNASPVWHLPRWAYNAPLPKTKLLSPHPAVTFSGWVRAGERILKLDDWPGTVGHNWGSEHARRTIWIHGTGFAGHEDAWLELAFARVKLGPMTTPWIANGVLCLDGERHRLGGIPRLRSTKVAEAIEHTRFTVFGDGVEVTGRAGAPRPNFVGWIYAQPQGGERQTINSSIADLRLEVARPEVAPVTLQLAGGAGYELQLEERYEPIPVQPFADG
ncbi:MAG TPA: hypothetical protein VMD09_16010 [Solirubrobacteraceae bacterium]|nr:hypothetical protein [Solirubrobacteraceae bacterium]